MDLRRVRTRVARLPPTGLLFGQRPQISTPTICRSGHDAHCIEYGSYDVTHCLFAPAAHVAACFFLVKPQTAHSPRRERPVVVARIAPPAGHLVRTYGRRESRHAGPGPGRWNPQLRANRAPGRGGTWH